MNRFVFTIIAMFATLASAAQSDGGVGALVQNTCSYPVTITIRDPGSWSLKPVPLRPGKRVRRYICRGAEWCGYLNDSWTTPRAHTFTMDVKSQYGTTTETHTLTASGTDPVDTFLVLKTC